MTKDLHSNVRAVQHLEAAVYTATQTPSSGVDLQGFESCEFLISIGEMSNVGGSPAESWSFHLEHSDSQSSGFEAVTDSDLVLTGSAASPVTAPDSSTGVFLVVDSAAEDSATYRCGYLGSRRHVRCVATAANTPGNTPLSITALLGSPNQSPTSD